MRHSWKNYKEHAWGSDELRPISKQPYEWLGQASTIVDSLDSLYIMGMKEEFEEAKNWVIEELKFNKVCSTRF